jgi:hypothetical protein
MADDNPYLDQSYWAMLETLPANLRKAFRYGDWNTFVGQAFPELSKVVHGTEPLEIPKNAPIYCTYDWGFGKPFSFGWWWVDADNRIYRFGEWYGWSGQADEGLRLSDTDVAIQLIGREKRILPKWAHPADVQRLAGHDLFAKKPDTKGGGQGPSTAEVHAAVAEKFKYPLYWRKGDSTRHLKIRQFRERLRVPQDGSRPMMLAYNSCEQFFRTLGNLILDEHNIEDVDTKGEDHVFDEVCHVCMARPLSLQPSKTFQTAHDKRIEMLKKGPLVGTYEEYATRHQEEEIRRLYQAEGIDPDFDPAYQAEYEDSDLVRTR